MKKHFFYAHLIEIESIVVELDKMDLSEQQKLHLAQLVDSHIQSSVLDTVLSALSDEDKKIFLEHLLQEDHDKIWEFLADKTENLEEKIKIITEQIKEDFKKDIREAKKRK